MSDKFLPFAQAGFADARMLHSSVVTLCGSVAQIGGWPELPHPRTDLSFHFRDGRAEAGEVNRDGFAGGSNS
jgi:hypothetical protein